MKKKILIYFNKNDIGHKGGPAGYLEPIFNNLSFFNEYEISFIEGEQNYLEKKVNIHAPKNKMLLLFMKMFPAIYDFVIQHKRLKNRFIENGTHRCCCDISQYDAIYFHMTGYLFNCRDSLKNYKGKVFLQSHCPKPQFLEIVEDSINNKFFNIIHKKYYERIDRYAFNKADYLVFPCPQAYESYEKYWPYFNKNFDFFFGKMRFVITGCNPIEKHDSMIDFRSKYNIPKKSMVFGFIGRHNAVKGYDLLKKIGKKFKNNNDIFFLICGSAKGVKVPRHSNWIECEFISDIYSFLQSCDYYLSLNRDTYFDLSVIEAMSCGKKIICSYSGGNKYIVDNSNGEILSFSTYPDLCNIINNLLKKERPGISNSNIQYYNSNFSVDKFLKNVAKLFDSCLK